MENYPVGKELRGRSKYVNLNCSVFLQCVEAILKVEYSGGPGKEAGYCRCCSVALSIDIQPSVFFHTWDVLPSDR